MFSSKLHPATRTHLSPASITRISAAQLILVLLFAAPALPQSTGANPGVGLPSFGSFAGSDFDTINEGNLNIHLSIPVFEKAGRGLPIKAALSFDSLIWTAAGAPTDGGGNPIGSAQWIPSAANPWGWTLAPFTSYVTYTRTQEPPTSCANGNPLWIRSNYAYHSPDGTGHFIGGMATDPDCTGTRHGFGPTLAQDGSGISLSVDSAMIAYATTAGGNLTIPGQIEIFPDTYQSFGIGGATTVTDTNGNQSNGLVDTLGPQAMQISSTSTSLSVTYPSPTNPANFVGVTLNYSTYTVQTQFNCFLTNYGPKTAQLVSSISMSDTSTYSFTYEPTPGAPANTTGRLASVTLPSGATIRYTYGPIDCDDGSNQSVTRTTPDGQWTYTRQITETPFSNGQPGQITSSITTVTDPLGNVTVINFGKGDKFEAKRQAWLPTSTNTTSAKARLVRLSDIQRLPTTP